MSKDEKLDYLDSVSNSFVDVDPVEGIAFALFCEKYIRKNDLPQHELAPFYLRIGQFYRIQRKYSLSLNYLLKAEEIFLKRNDKDGLQRVFSSYANLYVQIKDNVKAIRYALKAKNLAVELNKKSSLANTYNSLANLYLDQKRYDSALFYYRESLKILSAKDNISHKALLYDNISMVFSSKRDFDSARLYNNKALELAYSANDTYLELQLLFNTCLILEGQKRFDDELVYSIRAKHLADSIGIDIYMAYANLNMGAALANVGKHRSAIPIFRNSIPKLTELGDFSALASLYEELSESYEMIEVYDSSLYYHKLHTSSADSVEKLKALDQVNELLARYQVEKKEHEIENLNKLNSTFKERDQLKSLVIWISAGLMIVIVVLLTITFKRYKLNKQLNAMLNIKNMEIQSVNKNLHQKNNEITDSINYARKIQESILPSTTGFKSLFPASFVFYLPKDIVSGDFYWIAEHNRQKFIAVADCTGHGVPGGFMSMLGHSLLNEIILEKNITNPALILDQLREKVIRALKQTGLTGENKDGMDISLIVVNETESSLHFAGANNSVFMIRDNAMEELFPDKQPIGYYGSVLKNFTAQQVSYKKGDRVYLLTDGYPDQFGGTRGKKLMYKKMKEILVSSAGQSMEKQFNQVASEFMNWKGNYSQTDDVCLIGIEL